MSMHIKFFKHWSMLHSVPWHNGRYIINDWKFQIIECYMFLNQHKKSSEFFSNIQSIIAFELGHWQELLTLMQSNFAAVCSGNPPWGLWEILQGHLVFCECQRTPEGEIAIILRYSNRICQSYRSGWDQIICSKNIRLLIMELDWRLLNSPIIQLTVKEVNIQFFGMKNEKLFFEISMAWGNW